MDVTAGHFFPYDSTKLEVLRDLTTELRTVSSHGREANNQDKYDEVEAGEELGNDTDDHDDDYEDGTQEQRV
jgi:hypothetical protein